MERIRKSDFIDNCNRELEDARIGLEVYDAIENVVAANKDKQMNVRIARKIEGAIRLPDSFSAHVRICTEWPDGIGKRGIYVNIVKDVAPGLQWWFCVKIPHVIEKQKLDYERFCEILAYRKKSTTRDVESLNYTIDHLDDIISQSKNLLREMKEFYLNIPDCMREHLLDCNIYECTESLLGIY